MDCSKICVWQKGNDVNNIEAAKELHVTMKQGGIDKVVEPVQGNPAHLHMEERRQREIADDQVQVVMFGSVRGWTRVNSLA